MYFANSSGIAAPKKPSARTLGPAQQHGLHRENDEVRDGADQSGKGAGNKGRCREVAARTAEAGEAQRQRYHRRARASERRKPQQLVVRKRHRINAG
jgi:hypothetical protein